MAELMATSCLKVIKIRKEKAKKEVALRKA